MYGRDNFIYRIRVRSVVIDDSGDEPKLIYVYSEGVTNKTDGMYLDVYWDEGGLGCVKRNQNVEFLD